MMLEHNPIESFERSLEEAGLEVIHTFNERNYGPFKYLNEINPADIKEHENFVRRFKDGLYAIVTPKAEFINLFQLSGLKKPLTLYRPLRFLIGRTDHSGEKTSFLAYVPKPYLYQLANAQTDDKKIKAKELSNATQVHNEFYRNFYNKLYYLSKSYLDNYFANVNLRDLALNGNRRFDVPEEVLEAIQTNKINSTEKPFPIGKFDAHVEEIELPNGQKKTVTLTITTKFNGSQTQNYKEENCLITEKTENYSVLYNLSSV